MTASNGFTIVWQSLGVRPIACPNPYQQYIPIVINAGGSNGGDNPFNPVSTALGAPGPERGGQQQIPAVPASSICAYWFDPQMQPPIQMVACVPIIS